MDSAGQGCNGGFEYSAMACFQDGDIRAHLFPEREGRCVHHLNEALPLFF